MKTLFTVVLALVVAGCSEVPIATEPSPNYASRYSGRPVEADFFTSGSKRPDYRYEMRARMRPAAPTVRESNLIRCTGNSCDIVSPSGEILRANP